MKCPRCQSETKQKNIQNIGIDECPKCHGTWYDKDELRKLKDATDSDLDWLNFELWKDKDQFKIDGREIRCPHCQISMVGINYGDTNVKIHFCMTCEGMWLDKNQFKKIIDALEKEVDTMSFSEYVKTSIHEAKQFFTEPEHPISDWRDLMTVIRLAEYRFFSENPKRMQEMLAAEEETLGLPGV